MMSSVIGITPAVAHLCRLPSHSSVFVYITLKRFIIPEIGAIETSFTDGLAYFQIFPPHSACLLTCWRLPRAAPSSTESGIGETCSSMSAPVVSANSMSFCIANSSHSSATSLGYLLLLLSVGRGSIVLGRFKLRPSAGPVLARLPLFWNFRKPVNVGITAAVSEKSGERPKVTKKSGKRREICVVGEL